MPAHAVAPAPPLEGPAASRLDARRGRLDALLVVAGAAALILPWLGQRVISTSHEARFAVLAQDMLSRGAWFDARVGGEVYRNKPPLFPWSVAALSALHG